MQRQGYGATTVSDILTEAGLSTRAFYRHFETKDALLHGLFRRDAEQFAAAVGARVRAAGDPVSGVCRWIDEILGFGTGRPRARRAAVLGAPDAMQAIGNTAELQHALDLLIEPLAEAIAEGAADGSIVTDDPTLDAYAVSAIAWDTSGRLQSLPKRQAAAAADAARSFALRALGTEPRQDPA